MDRVTIMLQNKQLIEELINSSNEARWAVHAAIIDAVSKRIVKNVTTNIDEGLRKAVNMEEEKLLQKFMDRNTWGNLSLKREFVEAIQAEVADAWQEKIKLEIEYIRKKVAAKYEDKLKLEYERYIANINRMCANLDSVLERTVEKVIREKFSK